MCYSAHWKYFLWTKKIQVSCNVYADLHVMYIPHRMSRNHVNEGSPLSGCRILKYWFSLFSIMIYFTIYFKHQCNIIHTFKKAMYGSSGIDFVIWRTFISTLFATLLRNHKNCRDPIKPAHGFIGKSAVIKYHQLLSKAINIWEIAFHTVIRNGFLISTPP